MVALGNTGLALVCVLALSLSHSGRHERTAVCGLLLCVGPIAGCSAVLAVRRYCGYRSLVCAFVVCAEEAGSKTKKKEKRKKRKAKNRACHGPTLVGWPRVGPGRAGTSIFYMMDRGPARSVNFSEDGPRPGPAHHIFKFSLPSPSHGSEAHETRALYGPARLLSRTKRCMCIR